MNNEKMKAGQVVDALRPIDDVFWHKLAESSEFCKEVLQIILQKKDLTIVSSIPQKSLRNIKGRSVILDVMCKDEKGKFYNIEVQKEDNDDHQRRVRYNASNMDTYIAEKGIKFDKLPDIYVIFLSIFDLFQKGKTIYHVDRVLRETGEVLDNGYHEVYVNASVDDKTDIAALMKVLSSSAVLKDDRFQTVCREIMNLKEGKGRVEMCKIVEDYKAEGQAEGETKGKIIAYTECGLSVEEISEKLSLSIEEVKVILDSV